MVPLSYVLAMFLAFFIKHYVVDFLMQPPYMYLNKGTFLHPGGLLHAGLHGFVTALILFPAGLFLEVDLFATKFFICAALAYADFFIHYLIDFTKVNITKKYGLTATNSHEFWYLLGLDQLLHYLTYLIIIYGFFHYIYSSA